MLTHIPSRRGLRPFRQILSLLIKNFAIYDTLSSHRYIEPYPFLEKAFPDKNGPKGRANVKDGRASHADAIKVGLF